MDSSLQEKCGVFGVYAPGEDVARLTFFGLHALQHRGQESAGIATSDGREITSFARMGLVTQVFDERALSSLRGIAGIGHTRYSTTGSSALRNAQPFVVTGSAGTVALAHNGNVVNADLMRSELAEQGVSFETGTDSEVIAALLVNAPGETWEERFEVVMRRASGSYCLTVLTLDAVYAVRDAMGNRPLCIGRVSDDDGGGYVVASETCALDHLGAEFVREVAPGEVVRLDKEGLHSYFPTIAPQQPALCLFEYMYFARPDSRIRDELVHRVRTRLGAQLAREHPVEADLVIGVPDSGIPAAIGYARESGIPYAEGLIKNRYVGRTFIEPDQRLREQGVRLKLNPLPEVLRGRRVIVVEDTIVRGTTNTPVVAMLRRAGATEVHMRIAAPPITHPCFYGVDMATRGELIAAHQSVDQIRMHIGADSLGYLSLGATIEATRQEQSTMCTACFTGNYPSEVPLQLDKFVLEEAEQVAARSLPLAH